MTTPMSTGPTRKRRERTRNGVVNSHPARFWPLAVGEPVLADVVATSAPTPVDTVDTLMMDSRPLLDRRPGRGEGLQAAFERGDPLLGGRTSAEHAGDDRAHRGLEIRPRS